MVRVYTKEEELIEGIKNDISSGLYSLDDFYESKTLDFRKKRKNEQSERTNNKY
jgi:hypothetical protein